MHAIVRYLQSFASHFHIDSHQQDAENSASQETLNGER
jgi:hypothetical protein